MGLFTKLFERIRGKRFDVQSVERLILGIGNPGPDYESTRHNIGFMVIEELQDRLNGNREIGELGNALVDRGEIASGKTLLLAKPLTYVNRSGESFRALKSKCNLSLESCLVVTDDLNLPFGRIRFRAGGSAGGHNGLKSIIGEVGKDFPRLRIGIGPVPPGMPVIEFVLGQFAEHETADLGSLCKSAADAVEYFCDNGIDSAMNRFNST